MLREQELVERARAFAEEVLAPHAAGWERDRLAVPREVFGRYAHEGFSGLLVPVGRGGQGVSFGCKVRVAEAMARVCMAATFALTNIQGSIVRLIEDGTADQVARYVPGLLAGTLVCAPSLTEPEAGSDATAMTTLATKVAGGWRISGTKAWVTNGAHADLLVLYAQTVAGAGAKGIASFVVDLHAPGVRRSCVYALMGGGAIGAAEIVLEDVFVEDGELLSAPGQAFRGAMAGITAARVHVAGMVNGVVAECLERAVEYAGERATFGRRLLEHQGLRWSLADVSMQLEASRMLTGRAADLVGGGVDATFEAAQAKCFAADMAGPAVMACMQAMGAMGLSEEQPFGRHLMAARIAAYVDGTSEMQRDRIGVMLGARYRKG